MKNEKMMRIVMEDPNSNQQVAITVYRHSYKTIPPDHYYYLSGVFCPMAKDVVQITKSAAREFLYNAKSQGWKVWIRHGKIYV